MGDLDGLDATEAVRIVGSDLTGSETTPLGVETDQSARTRDFTSDLASGTGAALNATPISSIDLRDYTHIYVQLTGTFVADVTFEGSIDGTNWVSALSQDISSSSVPAVIFQSAPGIYKIPINFRHFRARISAYTSGIVTASAIYTNDAAGGLGKVNSDVNIDSSQLVPSITNKFRIQLNSSDINLPSSNAFVTLFTRTGTGLFFGFQTSFNNENINVRFTLDSGIVFDLNLDVIRKFQFNDTTTSRTQMGGFLTTIGNTLDFSSKFAIPYTTSILIEARSNDGVLHDSENWIVFATEDS